MCGSKYKTNRQRELRFKYHVWHAVRFTIFTTAFSFSRSISPLILLQTLLKKQIYVCCLQMKNDLSQWFLHAFPNSSVTWIKTSVRRKRCSEKWNCLFNWLMKILHKRRSILLIILFSLLSNTNTFTWSVDVLKMGSIGPSNTPVFQFQFPRSTLSKVSSQKFFRNKALNKNIIT